MFARLVLAVAVFVSACSGGGSGSSTSTPPPPAQTAQADVSILFFGNSHTSVNGVPLMVAAMVRVAWPGRTVEPVEGAQWMFLNERSRDAASLALLHSRPWRFVVLQAQEYSSSGQFEYPIDGAVELVRQSRAMGALPIMFPEWSRQGIPETQRIYELHLSI